MAKRAVGSQETWSAPFPAEPRPSPGVGDSWGSACSSAVISLPTIGFFTGDASSFSEGAREGCVYKPLRKPAPQFPSCSPLPHPHPRAAQQDYCKVTAAIPGCGQQESAEQRERAASAQQPGHASSLGMWMLGRLPTCPQHPARGKLICSLAHSFSEPKAHGEPGTQSTCSK